MKTKVCPCCDQPIQGMYCKGCRKIVLNPVEQDIKYYLNTRHPEFETDCSYHNETPRRPHDADGRYRGTNDEPVRSAAHRMTVSETEAKKAQIKERMAARKREEKSRSKSIGGKSPTQTVLNGEVLRRNGKSGKNGSAGKKIFIGIVIYLILCFGSTIGILFGNIADALDGFGRRTPEIAIAPEPMATAPALEHPLADAPIADAPQPDLEYSLLSPAETDAATMEEWELTDEEVRELGVACNGFGHFPAVFDDVDEVLRQCIRDAGYGWRMSVYSYNQFIDDYTWYETVYEFTIHNTEEYAGFLNITVDTVTGEIHGMEMYTHYEKGFFEVADIAVKFLDQIGVADELPSGTEFFKTAYMNQDDIGICIQNGLEVVCDVPELDGEDRFFRMEIYAPGYYTVAE